MTHSQRRAPSPVVVVLAFVLALLLIVGARAGWVYGVRHQLATNATGEALAQAERVVAEPAGGEVEVAPTLGEPSWILEIPRIDVRVPVLAGAGDDQLARGVAWYETTNLPGEAGNVALAGHRVGEGRPFARLLELQEGDEVRLETSLARYVYEVRVAPAALTVGHGATWVLDPVPGKDFDAHESILTLTAEQDLIPTDDLAVGFAVLKKKELK